MMRVVPLLQPFFPGSFLQVQASLPSAELGGWGVDAWVVRGTPGELTLCERMLQPS